ncbi:uncharacterized protein JCM10292_006900 [Rhodotorula paludigena]|uniref:uncharacterized protein n=1 Tax=Rhodotorula paludigena TaxID=86838 RepID=UPI00317A4BC5
MGALFSRPREPDYDTVLAKLQTQIAARQARLQQIRLRERRANALFITYGLAFWILYSVLWYFGVLGTAGGDPLAAVLAKGAPVVLGPIAIIFTRRGSRWYYHRKQDKEEKELKVLVKQKQDKVEEIKKKTGYYSTRDLLEKYDEALKKGPGSAPSTPAKQPVKTGNKPPVPFPGTPATPVRPGAPPSVQNTPQRPFPPGTPGAPGTPANPAGMPYPAFPPPPPPTPHTRSLMDKVADALLGVSPEDSNPMNRYALICGQCYAHNGLALKDEFESVQYRCPRCGYFNPPRRERGGSAGPSAQLGGHDQLRHRRVVSEFAPSPLSATFARPASAAGRVAEEREAEAAKEAEAERREVAETLLQDEAREGRDTNTTARKEMVEVRRRAGRTKGVAKGASEGEEGEDEDHMDTD